MPDTILNVQLTSDGARASAPAGTYPIRVSGIRFSTTDARARYSVKYDPGTMTVAAATPIEFVNKAQQGDVLVSTGVVTFTLPVAPQNHNTLVVIVAVLNSNAGGAVAPSFDAPTNATSGPYVQVGGSGYQAEFFADNGIAITDDFVLAVFTRKCEAGSDDGTVKINFSSLGTGGSAVYQLVVLEYEKVASTLRRHPALADRLHAEAVAVAAS